MPECGGKRDAELRVRTDLDRLACASPMQCWHILGFYGPAIRAHEKRNAVRRGEAVAVI